MSITVPFIAGCAAKKRFPIGVLAVSLLLFTYFGVADAQANQPPSAVAGPKKATPSAN